MKRPNIILISIDTLRADHLSCYGYNKPTTPNIDKLASEGTIYRSNYSTGVWTPPGHASMLTGLYVSEHGVYDTRRLSNDIPTIAEVLKGNGYQTAGFVNNSQVGELVNLHKGHDVFEEVWKGEKPKNYIDRIVKAGIRLAIDKLGYKDMGAKKTNQLFLEWINTIDDSKPFYAFIHYIEPHNPLNPVRPYKDRFLGRSCAGIDMNKINKIAHNPLICYLEDLKPNKEEIRYIKDLYDGEIAYTDGKVGEIADMLRSRGAYNDTMIIITSDHGEHFGEYGQWSHVASLHKEVLNVPLIIKYPKGIKSISEVADYTQSVDIFPTVVDVAGLSGTEKINVSGVSLKSGNSNTDVYHEYIFAEWEGRIPYFIKAKLNDNYSLRNEVERLRTMMSMVQDKTNKYILKSNGEEEIYDISGDIEELLDPNLYRDIISRLHSQLVKRNRLGRNDGDEDMNIDNDVAENLKSLGYM